MREHFPVFQHKPELIYLDSAATSHKPEIVLKAMYRFYECEYATVHRAAYRDSMAATEKYNEARETVQRFLKAASPEEIIFTRGATDAINLVARTFPFQPGDEIVISEMEHHSNIVPWQMASERTGAKLRWIPMRSNGTLDWESYITPKTKLVALAHISNVTGTINPIQSIAQAAHAVGAYLLVDGAQAAPFMPIDVKDLDCDFYAFSAHKCYGPTGIGILYGKKELLEMLPPLDGGGDMIEQVDLTQTTYQKPPLRFEAGTPIIAAAIGLKAALNFMTDIGLHEIQHHGQTLLQQAQTALAAVPGVKIIGTAPEKGPILTFYLEGVHPLDLATYLDHTKHIAIRSGHLCAQPLLKKFGLKAAARASFGIYNTKEDVDQFIDAVRQSNQFFKSGK